MRLMDYKLFSKDERLQYLNSQIMKTGIPYFGGKSRIGKYIYNTIFNMAVTMNDNGDKPKIFIDAFTGGGKIGISMPDGWFDTIVMNDLDYGVYCYYVCCQENYRLLLDTINYLVDNMSETMMKKCKEIRKDKTLDKYMCGAMTYLACALSFNNSVMKKYKPTMGDNNEKQELEKVRARANRAVTNVAKQFKRRNYIIENLDYYELIKKYTGKSWVDTEGNIYKPIAEKSSVYNNILFYFDPPYYSETLALGEDAPYDYTFSTSKTKKMTDILANTPELKYFIKSDYDPKDTIRTAEYELKNNDSLSDSLKNFYKGRLTEPLKSEMLSIFDSIEDESKGFQKICVGGFDKGAIKLDGNTSIGNEYIWTKGLPTDYNSLEKFV